MVSIGALIVGTGPGPYQWILETASETRAVPVRDLMVIRDDAWLATIERVELGPEMRLYLTSAKVRRALTLQPHQADAEPWLLHQMVLKGSVNLSTTDGQSIELTPDRAALFRTHDRHGRFTPAGGQTIRVAGYMLRLDRIRRISGGTLPSAFRPLARSDLRVSTWWRFGSIPHRGNSPVHCSISGCAARAGDLSRGGRPPAVRPPVSGHRRWHGPSGTDGARARRARGDPGGARAPAGRHAGAADAGRARLNAGFKTLFGTTVFATLRNARLEHARAALASGSVTMKQVAFAVGYNHVTNFIAAFAERYGAPPRRHVRRAMIAAPPKRSEIAAPPK